MLNVDIFRNCNVDSVDGVKARSEQLRVEFCQRTDRVIINITDKVVRKNSKRISSRSTLFLLDNDEVKELAAFFNHYSHNMGF